MLSVNTYSQKYIDEFRARVNAQLATYKKLVTVVRNQASSDETAFYTALQGLLHGD